MWEARLAAILWTRCNSETIAPHMAQTNLSTGLQSHLFLNIIAARRASYRCSSHIIVLP